MTKAEILTAVIDRTGRTDLTDIDDYLYAVLSDITVRFDFLKGIKMVTLSPGKVVYTIATDFLITNLKTISDIRDSNGKQVTQENSLSDLLNLLAGTTASGEPSKYALYGREMIMLYPTPDKGYVFTIYYHYLHPKQETILLGDELKECVISGVCYKVYEGLGIAEKGVAHRQSYETELYKNIVAYPMDDMTVKYRDI